VSAGQVVGRRRRLALAACDVSERGDAELGADLSILLDVSRHCICDQRQQTIGHHMTPFITAGNARETACFV